MADEGKLVIDAAGHSVAYWAYGAGDETLLALHGGPGMDHRYLTRLGELADDTLRVVLYDQLGSGRSDRPQDDRLWTMERFVAEVETVRTALGLGRVHLLGQSWGGWLALQYVLDHPQAVKSLILSNTSASIVDTYKGMVRLRAEMPAADYATVMRCEGANDLADPAYQAVVERLYATHVRRSTPYEIARSVQEYREIAAPVLDDVGPAYAAMWGPHEFLCTGSLIEWDVTGRLQDITAPTLILCGWYDHLVLELQHAMAERIPNNEFVIFGHSSHLTILEKEGDAYLAVIRDFVQRVCRA